jgi:hypothetical protein
MADRCAHFAGADYGDGIRPPRAAHRFHLTPDVLMMQPANDGNCRDLARR